MPQAPFKANFAWQIHGWGRIPYVEGEKPKGKRPPLKKLLNFDLPGKWHSDLRIRPQNASAWYGWTLVSNPQRWLGGKKSLALLKGYDEKKGKRLVAEPHPPGSHSTLGWMTFEGWIPPQTPGNEAAKNTWAEMWIIDKGPCIVRRMENDFVEVEFKGKILKGVYYIRRVKMKKLQKDPEGKPAVAWLFWKSASRAIPDYLPEPKLYIEGWASKPNRDEMGTIILPEGMRDSVKEYMKLPYLWFNHELGSLHKLCGMVVDYQLDERGLYIKGIIWDPEVAELIKRGVQGLSITFRADTVQTKPDDPSIITKIDLIGISITPFPANRDCLITKVQELYGLPGFIKEKLNDLRTYQGGVS